MIIIGATSIEKMPEGYFRLEVNRKHGDSVTREDAKKICQTIHELSEGKKTAKLTVMKKGLGVTMEPGVNEEFSKNILLNSIIVVEAFVFDSLAMRILIKLYMKLNPKKNSRAFKEESEARKWILKELERTL